jgi:RNA polymerase-binding transcription factor DksA
MADEERNQLLDRIEADLAGVEAALGRLDAGTYFSCEVCGTPLPDEALDASPLDRRCEACAGT